MNSSNYGNTSIPAQLSTIFEAFPAQYERTFYLSKIMIKFH